MLPAIIESMKDSPDEMNRKRYLVFVDLITKHNELADQESLDTQRFIAATKAIKEVCPTATSLEHGITLLAELARARESNSKPFSSWAGDHYGI